MRTDHEQIPSPSPPGRLLGGLLSPARAPARVRPHGDHPVPIPGLPGAQGVPTPRLARIRRAPGRPPRPRPADRPEGRLPLYLLLDCHRPTVEGVVGPPVVRLRAGP